MVVDRQRLKVLGDELAVIDVRRRFRAEFKMDQTRYPWLRVRVFVGYKSLYPYPYPGVTRDITCGYFRTRDNPYRLGWLGAYNRT